MGMAFYKIQAADEATAGTAVAATAKWNAYQIRPVVGDRTIIQPDEDRGSLAGAFTGYTTQLTADMGSMDGDCTFEDLILPCLMSLESITPTQPNSSTDPNEYLWSFNPSWTSANSPKTFTIEWGDDNQVYETEYCFCPSLTISGNANEAWQVSAALRGRQHTSSTFTGALSDRSIERAIFNKGTVYFDDTGGTIGTTEFSCDLTSFSWDLPNHFEEFYAAGSQLYFCGLSEMKVRPTLTLEMIVDATSKALLTTDYTAETVQLVRVRTTGTTMDNNAKYINIDGAYRITDLGAFDENGGLTTISMTLTGEYDSGLAKMFSIDILNGVSAIP